MYTRGNVSQIYLTQLTKQLPTQVINL